MNIRLGVKTWLVAAVLMAVPATTLAAVDSFIWFDGVQGTSREASHQGAFEIQDFSFGVENPTTIGSATSGAGAGKVKFKAFTIRRVVDSASPLFQRAATNGQRFRQVRLEMRKSGGDPKEFLVYTFTNVMVTRVQMSGSGGDRPVESITCIYEALSTQAANPDTARFRGNSSVMARPGLVQPPPR